MSRSSRGEAVAAAGAQQGERAGASREAGTVSLRAHQRSGACATKELVLSSSGRWDARDVKMDSEGRGPGDKFNRKRKKRKKICTEMGEHPVNRYWSIIFSASDMT